MKKSNKIKIQKAKKRNISKNKALLQKSITVPNGKKITIKRQEGKKLVLHVGCGNQETSSGLHKSFKGGDWQEVRLDIDPSVKPDIISDMINMHMLEDNIFDAIWSSHNIEHVFAHQVGQVLKEFNRVLSTNGYVFISCPDIESVAEFVVKSGLETPMYKSPTGSISAIDVLYGHRPPIAGGAYFMAHKTGFTAHTMAKKLLTAGFCDVKIQREGFNLWVMAYKRDLRTKQNTKPVIIGKDLNKMMKERDELDIEPSRWFGYPPKKAS